MKKHSIIKIFFIHIFLCIPGFQISAQTLKPQTELFFTQAENCYSLKLTGVEPSAIQMELPELPSGTRFISSKKEEFISENNDHGTLITIWFNFAYPGLTQLHPLLTRINGRLRYFEFEQVMVHENPALISPVLEVSFENIQNIQTDKKKSKKIINVKKGEKIIFDLSTRYSVQILNFSWEIPKDSIFTEKQRFDFTSGNEKITQFTEKPIPLSRFEWQILKDGTFTLPEFSVTAIAYNGSKKALKLTQNIEIHVSDEINKKTNNDFYKIDNIFSSSFEPDKNESSVEKNQNNLTEPDYEKMALKEKLTFWQKLTGKKYAVFKGGLVYTIPEEKSGGQFFTGGPKIKITETAGNWIFIEGKEFSGWTQSINLIKIK
ncbi:hypothetical protein [Treponema sp.]|uniref:hypothetical protein n=1 Tax=Treponema sp. TaxID=166 RepID=UPI003890B0E4